MKQTLIITGPSGVGKTYLSDFLTSNYPELFHTLKITTTRKPRLVGADSDRSFLSLEDFENMEKAGKFFASGPYNGNYYGFPFIPKNPTHNLIFNIWPELIPDFTKIDNLTLVTLTVADDNIDLIVRRLKERYKQKPDTLQKRLNTVASDLEIIKRHSSLINQHGQVFFIEDDKSIHTDVIPYILDKIRS